MVLYTVVACTDELGELICPSTLLEPAELPPARRKAIVMIHPAITHVPDPSRDPAMAQDYFFVFLDHIHVPSAADQLAGPLNAKTVHNIVEAQLFLESCTGILEAEIMGYGHLLSASIVARMDGLVFYRTKPFKTDKVFDWIPTDWVPEETPGQFFDTYQYWRPTVYTVHDLVLAKSFDESRLAFYRSVDFRVIDNDPCSLELATDTADVALGITTTVNPLTGQVILEGQTATGLVRHEFLDISTHKYICIGRLVLAVLEALEAQSVSIQTIR